MRIFIPNRKRFSHQDLMCFKLVPKQFAWKNEVIIFNYGTLLVKLFEMLEDAFKNELLRIP